jgi:hypothetical protein
VYLPYALEQTLRRALFRGVLGRPLIRYLLLVWRQWVFLTPNVTFKLEHEKEFTNVFVMIVILYVPIRIFVKQYNS